MHMQTSFSVCIQKRRSGRKNIQEHRFCGRIISPAFPQESGQEHVDQGALASQIISEKVG